MSYFLISLIPPALWSATNYLDKYLLGKYFKGGGVGALMIFSSLIGLLLLPIILIFHPEVTSISFSLAFLTAINGFLYVLAVLPYFYALEKDEASTAVPMFQLIPVFSYVLAYIVLKETLLLKQIIGGVLIIIGAIVISLELGEHKVIKFKKEVFGLMTLSSLLFSLNFLFFKYFALQTNFWITSFWEYIGFAIFALILIVFVKPYRKEFVSVMKQNKLPVLSLNSLNEILNILAKLSFNFASLLAPITIIWIINGLQPAFIFIYGIILTLFFPNIIKESLEKKHLLQKSIAIIIMITGTFFLK